MGAIANDWLPAVQAEFGKPYYRELYKFVTREYANGTVYPPAQDIFNALHLTPLSKVKAVILGQDPYHGDHQAHGLCFSVQPGTQIPPSLVNIYKELHDDLGCRIPDNGCLTWNSSRTPSCRLLTPRTAPSYICSGVHRPSPRRPC